METPAPSCPPNRSSGERRSASSAYPLWRRTALVRKLDAVLVDDDVNVPLNCSWAMMVDDGKNCSCTKSVASVAGDIILLVWGAMT